MVIQLFRQLYEKISLGFTLAIEWGYMGVFIAFVKTKTKTATLSSASSQNIEITDGGSQRDLSCNLYTVDIIFQTGRIAAIGECFP